MNSYLSVRFLLVIGTLAAPALITGCAVPFPTYAVSSENISTIRAQKNTVQLGAFQGEDKKVLCRGLAGISPEGDKTFSNYIRSAFNDEIVISGRQLSGRQVPVSVKIEEIDVDCAIGTGNWKFVAVVTVGERPPFTVTTTRPFEGSFTGALVYERARQALVPSIQQLIKDIMASPTFKAELAG